MIEALVALPGWVIAIVAGALAGLAGIGLGLLLRDIRPGIARYLPLVLFVIGYAATDRFAVPALMRSELAFCAIAQGTAEKTTAERAGTKQDAVTMFVATTADCTDKVLTTTYKADAGRADIDPAGLANVEAAFTADTCGTPQLRRMIAAGWIVENIYEFRSGTPLVMVVEC